MPDDQAAFAKDLNMHFRTNRTSKRSVHLYRNRRRTRGRNDSPSPGTIAGLNRSMHKQYATDLSLAAYS